MLLLSTYYVSDIVLGLEGKAVNKSDTALGVSFILGMGWGRQIVEGPIRIQCKSGKGRAGGEENRMGQWSGPSEWRRGQACSHWAEETAHAKALGRDRRELEHGSQGKDGRCDLTCPVFRNMR